MDYTYITQLTEAKKKLVTQHYFYDVRNALTKEEVLIAVNKAKLIYSLVQENGRD